MTTENLSRKAMSTLQVAARFNELAQQEKWFEIRLKDSDANKELEAAAKQYKQVRLDFEKAFEAARNKITQGDDLAPGYGPGR